MIRPDAEVFRHRVLSLTASYPIGRGYQKDWKGWGVTQHLTYRGERFISKQPGDRVYCSGIMFEVFWRAWQQVMGEDAALGNLDAMGFEDFRQAFYGVDGNEKTMVNAIGHFDIDSHGPVGEEITNLGNWLPGYFCQFWRQPTEKHPTGTGHAVVLRGLGERIEYWSAQGSTDGIGLNSEPRPERIYLARVGFPVETMKARGMEIIPKGKEGG